MTAYYTIVKHLKSKHAQEPIVLDNLSEFHLRQIIVDEIPLTLKQQAAPIGVLILRYESHPFISYRPVVIKHTKGN